MTMNDKNFRHSFGRQWLRSLLVIFFLFFSQAHTYAQDKLLTELGKTDNVELETLLTQAQLDFVSGHSIDARNKLLRSTQLAPTDFRPQLLLGLYYLSEVGHFPLAEKYLVQAHTLFAASWGSELDGSIKAEAQQTNSRILGLLVEAKINLDQYEQALDILDRFNQTYTADWFPSTKSWVLMKLKRIDEAIFSAQLGLTTSTDLGRTLNMLGILFSLKGNTTLALQSFVEAIKFEQLLGGEGQLATPLNNLGEVYREQFSDRLAEAAWQVSLQYSSGCEHILTSLNAAILQIDELRLNQAARTLKDFESCYSRFPQRIDSEHKALLALGYGKVALRRGQTEEAIGFFQQALSRQQWFGKIGTDKNDVRLAALVGLGQAYLGQSRQVNKLLTQSLTEQAKNVLASQYLKIKGRWMMRQAQILALRQLDNFEDLHLRHTDSMLEYPTLGNVLETLPISDTQQRLDRLIAHDPRPEARSYYQLYQAANFRWHGRNKESLEILEPLALSFRPFDRLALAETIVYQLNLQSQNQTPTQLSNSWSTNARRRIELLFAISPAHFAYYDLALPVRVSFEGSLAKETTTRITTLLAKANFLLVPPDTEVSFQLTTRLASSTSGHEQVNLALLHIPSNKVIAEEQIVVADINESMVSLINKFVAKVFCHHDDPEAEPLPRLTVLDESK